MPGIITERPIKRKGIDRLIKPNDTWPALFSRLVSSLIFVVGFTLYFITNRLAQYRTDTVIFAFPFDPELPFIPSYVFIYASYHLFIFVSVFLYLRDPERVLELKRFSRALFWAAAISAVIFIIMPTHVPRPSIQGQSLAHRLLKFIYSNDQPYNCFPSMHVSWTMIASTYLQRLIGHRKLLTVLNWTYLILICLSTVFTRQHYTTDVVGGLIVGAAVLAAMHWYARRQADTRS